MKAVRLAELKALLASHVFLDFWGKLKAARKSFADATEQYDELLTQATLTDFRAELAQKNGIDTLYLAGEAEDLAARHLAESSTYENRGLDLVAQFEDQRYISSDAWYKLNAAERALEDKRVDAGEAAERKAPTAGKLEAEVKRLAEQHAELKGTYDREDRKKQALWDQVESVWARSAELSLIVAEKRLEAKKIKRNAETLFRQAEERKVRAQTLRADAEALARSKEEARKAADALLLSVLPTFGGVAVGDFLYFRIRENPKSAFAVAVSADPQTYNLELQELHVYQVDLVRGVAFLEPAVEHVGTDAEGDRRFEEYFLHDRKGRVVPPSAGGGDPVASAG